MATTDTVIPATPAELRAWRARVGLSVPAAAQQLGVSKRQMGYLLAGERDGQAVAIPRYIALAAVALEMGAAA